MPNYTEAQLAEIGLKTGTNVAIDASVRFFGAEAITIGSNVRIDCQCVISARQPLTIGNHVHLGVSVQLFGASGIEIGDFCGLSPRVTVFSATDDFVTGYLTGPTVPDDLRNVTEGKVTLHKHAVVGCGSVVLPGVTLGEGCSVGTMSIITKDVAPFAIAYGVNKVSSRKRDRDLMTRLENELRSRET